VKYGRAPFSYAAGEPLGDFEYFFDHAPGSPQRNDFEIASSAYRLRKSRCFLESKGALTCTTCHDPHDVRRGEEAAAHFNGVCGTCHAALPAAHVKAANCIECHMPKRRTQDVIHAVMTDHLIQRRAPANALAMLSERGEFDAKQYRGPVVDYFPAPPLYEAVAQVTQQSNLKAGLPRLAAEIAKAQPKEPQFYVELGEAYMAAGNARDAAAAFEQALKRGPGLQVALLDLVTALTGMGQAARASEMVRRLGGDDPLLWFQAGDYEKALALDPDLAAAHNALGERLAESGDPGRAEQEFRAALRSEPDLPDAQSNLGHALAARREWGEAAWYFERAVKRTPKDADTRLNYGVALRALRRDDDALREFEAALKLRPGFGLAHLNAAEILVARGDASGARAHWVAASKDADPEIRQRALAKLR
jgi:tetratricopeptide (TPR) repeat protein